MTRRVICIDQIGLINNFTNGDQKPSMLLRMIKLDDLPRHDHETVPWILFGCDYRGTQALPDNLVPQKFHSKLVCVLTRIGR
jgi:hypothetical protein